MKKLDYYVVSILAMTLLFTIVNEIVFCIKGIIPDTLITMFFTYIVGELLVCGLIKTVGEHQANRAETLEDRKYERLNK